MRSERTTMKVSVTRPRAIILDVVSTAVKAGFIEKILLKYLRDHGRDVIAQKWADPDFKEIVALVRRQVRKDQEAHPEMPRVNDKNAPLDDQINSVYQNMLWMTDNGVDTDAHYRLKYAIYEIGYTQGRIVTHVYQDVARNLRIWTEQGIRIVLFSHAWVRTQKLLMKYTNHGDLSPCIDTYFDEQTIGPMSSYESFQKIQEFLQLPPNDIIFVTKGITEGNAAKMVAIHTILVISHGWQQSRYNPRDLASFERIRSFDELVWAENPSHE